MEIDPNSCAELSDSNKSALGMRGDLMGCLINFLFLKFKLLGFYSFDALKMGLAWFASLLSLVPQLACRSQTEVVIIFVTLNALFQRVKFVSILSIIECNIWNRQ
jgi:hypothetical protein